MLGRGERGDALGDPRGQTGIHVERRVRSAEQLFDQNMHGLRRACAAVRRRNRDQFPAALVELLPRIAEAGGSGDLTVLEGAPGGVADGVERAGHLADEAVALAERALHLFLTPCFERRLPEDLTQPELLEDEKIQLAKVSLVAINRLDGFGHGVLLRGSSAATEYGSCAVPHHGGRMNRRSV